MIQLCNIIKVLESNPEIRATQVPQAGNGSPCGNLLHLGQSSILLIGSGLRRLPSLCQAPSNSSGYILRAVMLGF